MITKLINKAKQKYDEAMSDIANGIIGIVFPKYYKGYKVYYSTPIDEPCPNCGHDIYCTDDPAVAFCPFCRNLFDLECLAE